MRPHELDGTHHVLVLHLVGIEEAHEEIAADGLVAPGDLEVVSIENIIVGTAVCADVRNLVSEMGRLQAQRQIHIDQDRLVLDERVGAAGDFVFITGWSLLSRCHGADDPDARRARFTHKKLLNFVIVVIGVHCKDIALDIAGMPPHGSAAVQCRQADDPGQDFNPRPVFQSFRGVGVHSPKP